MRDDILEDLETDAPGSHDPFASADVHVSLSPNRCESEASASPRGDTQLSATFDPDFESSRDTTEVCTNASATASREPNSMYDISQDFRPDTPFTHVHYPVPRYGRPSSRDHLWRSSDDRF